MSPVRPSVGVGRQFGSDAIEVVHTRVFAAHGNGGNPCPVIPAADGLTNGEMQVLAQQLGQDTVFLLRPYGPTADLRLRYFVPDQEMGISGHATIAAITVAVNRGIVHSDHLKIETLSGLFGVALRQKGKDWVVTVEQNPPVFGLTASADQVACVLNLQTQEIAANESPIQAVSVSRPKLIVPVKDCQALNRMAPDFRALWRLCEVLEVSGLYAFTRRTDKADADVEARQFPLRTGFPEDPATGVAAAALAAYLAKYDLRNRTGRHEFRIAQGYAMGAPSVIDAIAECAGEAVTRTAIRGKAEMIRIERLAITAK